MTTSGPRADPPLAATGQGPLREMLRDRAFSLYLLGQTTSGAGSALSSVALVFAVLSISRSASSVGLVLLTSRLPGIALSLAGGIVADRRSRRAVTVTADAVRTAAQAITSALLLTGHASVGEIAALQLIVGSASAMFNPAANALLAGVAPQGRIRQATSLLGITTATAQTGGLAVSGVLVAVAGPGISLAVDAATFAVSSLTLALIPATRLPRPAPGAKARSTFHELREGWKLFGEHRWMTIYAVHETAINILVLSPFFVLGPVIAKTHLGGAPAWSAVALGYVVGNFIASNVTYRWAPQRPVLAALLIDVALAPMVALIGVAAAIWLIVPAAMLAGAATTIYNTLLGAAVQANLPDHTLGRATAVISIGSTTLVPLGMGLAGIAAGALGASTVMLSGAIIIIATAACLLFPVTRIALQLDRADQATTPQPEG